MWGNLSDCVLRNILPLGKEAGLGEGEAGLRSVALARASEDSRGSSEAGVAVWGSLPRWCSWSVQETQETWVWSLGCVGKIPGGGHGYPFQYSCLENPMDRGAWSDMTEVTAHVLVVCHKGARSLRLHINPTLMSAAWPWAKHPSSTKAIPTEVCHSGASQSISRLVIHRRHGLQKCCRVQHAFHCH